MRTFNDPDHPFVIAEAAGSHGQDYATAEALVSAAAAAGADAVKFQLITPHLLCADVPLPLGTNPAHDRWVQALGVTSMRTLFAHGGLPRAWCLPLKVQAEGLGITWLCTPFSLEDARFLVEEVRVEALKIASGDLTFTPLLAYAASTGLPLLVSTGAATLVEIEQARAVLRGAAGGTAAPLAFLHCTSVYPCPDTAVNLRAIATMVRHYGQPIGFSDHSLSLVVPALAVALGARVVEKHFRLAGDTTSVDAAHSLPPEAFAAMVAFLRMVPVVLGTGEKHPHALEMHDRLWARRDPTDWLRPQAAGRLGAWE